MSRLRAYGLWRAWASVGEVSSGGAVLAGLVTPTHAAVAQRVFIVGPTTTLGYLKVKIM